MHLMYAKLASPSGCPKTSRDYAILLYIIKELARSFAPFFSRSFISFRCREHGY